MVVWQFGQMRLTESGGQCGNAALFEIASLLARLRTITTCAFLHDVPDNHFVCEKGITKNRAKRKNEGNGAVGQYKNPYKEKAR